MNPETATHDAPSQKASHTPRSLPVAQSYVANML